jgi:hypothetical protein
LYPYKKKDILKSKINQNLKLVWIKLTLDLPYIYIYFIFLVYSDFDLLLYLPPAPLSAMMQETLYWSGIFISLIILRGYWVLAGRTFLLVRISFFERVHVLQWSYGSKFSVMLLLSFKITVLTLKCVNINLDEALGKYTRGTDHAAHKTIWF